TLEDVDGQVKCPKKRHGYRARGHVTPRREDEERSKDLRPSNGGRRRRAALSGNAASSPPPSRAPDSTRTRVAEWKEAEPLARSTGLHAHLIDLRAAHDLGAALDAARRQRIGALIVGVDAVTQANRGQIAQALIKRRLPSMSREREFVE